MACNCKNSKAENIINEMKFKNDGSITIPVTNSIKPKEKPIMNVRWDIG